MAKFLKIGKVILILLVIVIAVNVVLGKSYSAQQIKYGVTFSPKYASYLNLDWQKTYLQILDELQVKNLRIPTYWDVLEPNSGKYEFSETDFMLEEAAKRGAKVILVLGARQPRWPECHIPTWVKSLTITQRQQKTLEFVAKVVGRYQDHPEIISWQVENEPFLASFGEGCDKADEKFLKTEIDLVRAQSRKKIIISDSGELGTWIVPMQTSDIFGTTLYRRVYDKFLGYITFPLPPYYYNLKSSMIRRIFAAGNQKTIIVEFQAEPWLAGRNFVSTKEQSQLFTADQFKSNINYVGKTGFDEVYLWGVEWWYFMAKNGHPEYLNFAKTLFK